MANKRHKPEEIIIKLRQFAVLVGHGMARVDANREARITAQSRHSDNLPRTTASSLKLDIVPYGDINR